MPNCSKCDADSLMPHLRVLIRARGFAEGPLVQAERNPQALIFRGGVTSSLEATVCGSCGYTELYATDRRRLWEAVEEGRSRAKNK
jgi:hypothetical protein